MAMVFLQILMVETTKESLIKDKGMVKELKNSLMEENSLDILKRIYLMAMVFLQILMVTSTKEIFSKDKSMVKELKNTLMERNTLDFLKRIYLMAMVFVHILMVKTTKENFSKDNCMVKELKYLMEWNTLEYLSITKRVVTDFINLTATVMKDNF